MFESQNPFVFWLECAVIFVLLYFLVKIIDKIIVAGGGKSKIWKKHISDEFPEAYSDICFTCSAVSCKGCKFDKRGV